MNDTSIYLHAWKHARLQGLQRDFGISARDLNEVEVLLASYSEGHVYAEAFVLFRRGQQLYEVNAAHHSCRGLVGQWQPEETLVEALQYRLDHGELGQNDETGNRFEKALRQVICQLNVAACGQRAD